MRCIKCGHQIGPATPVTLEAEVRGEIFAVEVTAPRCHNCGRVVLNSRARRMHFRAASDAYRKQHGLLTAAEIYRLRRGLGMTWKQFADYVGIGVATFKRWMGGEIQSEAYNSLVRLKADLKYAEQAASDLLAMLTLHSECVQPAIEVAAQTAVRRARRRVHHSPEAADTQYALAA